MSDAEFFFDYACPWSYLACVRLKEATMRTGATILWRPLMLDTLFEALDSPLRDDRRSPNLRVARYQDKDLDDWARYCNLTLQLPDKWPASAEVAARGAIVAQRENKIAGYSEQVFRACFETGEDISELATVVGIAGSIGLDPDSFVAQLQDPATVAEVQANADTLIERGGFGTPTMFVGDDLYFGNDRMPLVEFALAQASGRTFVMPGQHS